MLAHGSTAPRREGRHVPQVEREITTSVRLVGPHGRLDPAAHGWSRTPLHDTTLPGGPRFWGRNKRWEYWGLVTPTHVVGLTISDLDYAAVHQLYVLDRRSGDVVDAAVTSPLGRGTVLPASLAQGPARASGRRFDLAIDDVTPPGDDDVTASGLAVPPGAPRPGRATRLRARTPRVELDVVAARRPGWEAMCVVVPFGTGRYQYTVKDVAIPLHGSLVVDGERLDVGEDAWAVLDHGRGRWPYARTWNWAAGSGMVDGVRTGLQLGGRWTVGSGSTENALVLDGVVHKISEEVVWDYDRDDWMRPWRVRGERVDVTFTPFHARRAVTNLVVLAGDTTQCFGTWEGWVTTTDGERVRVDGLVGWAEEAKNRW